MEKELRFQADRYYDFKNFTKELKDNRKHRRDERRKKRLEKKAERRKLSLQKDTLFTKTKFN
jgi:hypothetical protein